ncbi:MAG: hypothetical protein KQJ78_09850 [Deltaproteobacteria bacterium]|nr:hypothetical protein [Deltaproteobacteria bacterium]
MESDKAMSELEPKIPQEAKDFATLISEVKLLLLELEGVVTDGRVYHDAQGGQQFATYRADEAALTAWLAAGRQAVVLARGDLPAAQTWCRRLGLPLAVHQGDKERMFRMILTERGLGPRETAYLGADLDDMAPMVLCGVAICPPQAPVWLREMVHVVTQAAAGRGMVREAVDMMLAGHLPEGA